MEAFSPDLLIILAVAYILSGLSISPDKKLSTKSGHVKSAAIRDSTRGLLALPPRNKSI